MRMRGVLAAGTVLAVAASCSSEMPPVGGLTEGDDRMTITGSLLIPDMTVSMTRGALGDQPGAGLKLTLLEFTKGVDAANTFLSHIYHAELIDPSNAGNDGTVTFKFTVMSSADPKIMHLIVADDYVNPAYGPEATIMPALSTASNQEAYWGCVEFPNGITAVNADNEPELLDEVWDILRDVPVIRNFAKITVTEDLDNFEILGYDLVNVPTAGTIGPWNVPTLSVPQLTDGTAMKSYTEITDNVKYYGVLPDGVTFRNQEEQAKNWTAENNALLRTQYRTAYIYEHPYESTRRTYIILNATYNGQQGFYKVDIGRPNQALGTFDYCNIIRNIHYNVRIRNVYAAGAPTVAEAMALPPFNNLIAATETASMLNVSDGKNMLIVNDTNHIVVTEEEKIEVMYRYIEDVTGTKTDNNNFEGLRVVGLEAGSVINSWEGPTEYTDGQGVKWVRYLITPNSPTDEVKTQDFTIVDNRGLGRTIHLILRKPWNYQQMYGDFTATVKPGTDNLYGDDPAPEAISSGVGEPFTVYFNLPNGLPESMFPLEFQVESKYQGIENNKIGTLVVNSGPSLFDPNRIAISYIKTVSYSEYMYQYASETSEGFDVDKPNSNHTVRCRFLTITAQSNPETDPAQIRVYNPYFSGYAEVSFVRE